MEIGFPVEHPGLVLWEEYLQPLNITATQLATDLHISDSRAQQLLTGQTTLTTDLALRLSRYLGTSAEFWANWQTLYDLQQVDKFEGHVYVLHSFTKTTSGVDHQAMATAKLRYKTLKAGLGKSK